ncbi:MAG TPA: hypothetical protein IAA32_02855 [Candidatus Butyricicoccus stercorigallinarum]|nr:hypothetical protein [Candidatus Butyricicoccus stercorigallinarum]
MSAPYQFPETDAVQQLSVERFAGVDFAAHPNKVDWSRSPDACNMIANDTFFPVKRTGYRRIVQFYGEVFGLHRFGDDVLCHEGKNLWRMKGNKGARVLIYEDMNEGKSDAFLMGGKLWLLDGKTYLVYDGETVQPVRDIAYVPTTTIGCAPEGGGTSLEAVNLLTPKRINTFVGDGTSRVFQLDCTEIDLDSVQCEAFPIQMVNTVTGQVTFAEAPPDAGGLANVVIQFSKTTEHASIDRCRICGLYGGKNDTRVFVSGNPDEPNCDWQSGLYDPTYFPDTGYTRIGSDASEIMGYARQYDTQVVLKSDGQDARQYLRTFSLDENDRPSYPLRQGAEAAGAVSRYAIDVLAGTPLYLSAQGVMGIFGTNVTEYRTVAGLSQRIDARLCREALADAVSCVWEDKYYLAVGGHCYVADSRQTENSVPEWYYWDNIPAVCFLADAADGRLWFGTADGRVCAFFLESDPNAYLDDGVPTRAHWATPFSALDVWNRTKTILDCRPLLMPFGYSGAEIWYRTDSLHARVHTISFSQFSFAHVDFSRFSFCSAPAAVPAVVRRRVRRAYLFQLIVRSEQAEPFGLLGMTLRYQVRTPVRER